MVYLYLQCIASELQITFEHKADASSRLNETPKRERYQFNFRY